MYSSQWMHSIELPCQNQENWTLVQEKIQMICNSCESHFQTIYKTDDTFLVIENANKTITKREIIDDKSQPRYNDMLDTKYYQERYNSIDYFPVKHKYDLELDRTMYAYTVSFFQNQMFYVYFICDIDKMSSGNRTFHIKIKSQNLNDIDLVIDFLD